MVNVTAKAWTHRRALARCLVSVDVTDDSVVANVRTGTGASTDAAAFAELCRVATLAGVQAAKRTATLIPLCHPLAVSHVEVDVRLARLGVEIGSTAEVDGPTGVEMEALTACAAAALTVVALLGPEGEVAIDDLGLWEKSGGRSGHWVRS